MTKAQWLERCANHFIKVAKMLPAMAYYYANVCYANDDPDDGLTPEQAADNEMECWSS
jgi:hypothetical protein